MESERKKIKEDERINFFSSTSGLQLPNGPIHEVSTKKEKRIKNHYPTDSYILPLYSYFSFLLTLKTD
jgi:hypothetical protein